MLWICESASRAPQFPVSATISRDRDSLNSNAQPCQNPNSPTSILYQTGYQYQPVITVIRTRVFQIQYDIVLFLRKRDRVPQPVDRHTSYPRPLSTFTYLYLRPLNIFKVDRLLA